jgi:energy-coupling factor transporter ATP-binding protein EcfA2
MADTVRFEDAQIDPQKLHSAMADSFSIGELRTFAGFELGIDIDDLPEGGRSDKIRELVQRCQRERRLPELTDAVIKARPHIPRYSLFVDTQTDRSPFKGLFPFEEQDADIFFGRESLVTKLASELNLQPGRTTDQRTTFLALVGASGSGKSSLARAGLLPVIRKESGWPIHVITPTSRPLETMAISLTRDSQSVTATETLIDDLGTSSRALHLYARKLLSDSPSPASRNESRLLLLVDQFEELFTLCRDEPERRAFVDNLVHAVQPDIEGAVSVVITLRADFYGHCLDYGSLHHLLENQQRIVGGEPGGLPLLSHALLETWKRREGHQLTLAGYTSAGGVMGAIARTAESTYQRLSPEQQAIAGRIFLRLTDLGEEMQYTRRRAKFGELISDSASEPQVMNVIHILSQARLITTARESLEVAHEALIRRWPRLVQWLEDDRDDLRLHRRLADAVDTWLSLNKDPATLYRGRLLTDAQDWAERHQDDLNIQEREFLENSQVAVDAETKAREAALERELRMREDLLEREREVSSGREWELIQARALAESEKQRALEQEEYGATLRSQIRKRNIVIALLFVAFVVTLGLLIFIGFLTPG